MVVNTAGFTASIGALSAVANPVSGNWAGPLTIHDDSRDFSHDPGLMPARNDCSCWRFRRREHG
jgi:hypothetical protein